MDKLEKALEKARDLRQMVRPSPRPQQQPYVRATTEQSTLVEEPILAKHRVMAHHARSAEADAFKFLRTQVLQTMAQKGFKTLAITSPNYGDGKTTTAINLAMSIALDLKQTVLLVDLDLRKPNMHEFLGITPTGGLHEHLVHGVPLSECLVHLSFDRLSVLPAGAPMDQSSEFLASPQMAALANEMKSRYPDRLVIYDMPPLLTQDDPLAFLPHIDAVLLVVKEGVTTTEEVKRSLDILSSATVLGTVLNDSTPLNRRSLLDSLFIK